MEAINQVPAYYQLMAGGGAGLIELMLMYPFDVYKTQQMLSKGHAKSTSGRRRIGMLATLNNIARTQGVKTLYRGICPPMLMEAPKRAMKFTVNDSAAPILGRFIGKDNLPLAVGSGAAAGLSEALIVAPFEKIKVRMQDRASMLRYVSSWDCLRKTVRTEGPRALIKGLSSTMFCQGMWNSGYFGTIWIIRSRFSPPESNKKKMAIDIVAGSTGGLVGTIMGTPFDVVKSRVQQMEIAPGHKPPPTLTVLRQVVMEEGLTACYKGFKPKAARLVPGGGILLAGFEQAKQFFQGNNFI